MANSALHEGLVALFRDRPELAPTLLRDALGARLPPHDAIAVGTEAIPAFNASPLACDAVLRLSHNGRPTSAILIEIQLRTDARKLYSWPVYVATARRALKVPVRLLVITPLPAVARWARQPIELSGHGSVLLPDVLGPDAIPEITHAEDAILAPEVAVLSALAHAGGNRGKEIVTAFYEALGGVDARTAALYLDLVLAASRGAVRAALEALMQNAPLKIKNPVLRKIVDAGRVEGEAKGKAEGKAEGKADAVLAVLEAREIAVTDTVAARVRACGDLAKLDRWVRRAATVAQAKDLFAR